MASGVCTAEAVLPCSSYMLLIMGSGNGDIGKSSATWLLSRFFQRGQVEGLIADSVTVRMDFFLAFEIRKVSCGGFSFEGCLGFPLHCGDLREAIKLDISD